MRMSDPIGDRAGEPRHLERGRYSAWAYVVVAFIYQVLFVGGTLGLLLGAGVGAAIHPVSSDPDTVAGGIYLTAAIVGLAGAWLVYRDRWHCIEAFSSRFCSGLMNLSIIYVPVVAFVYANVRGVNKLRGR